MAIIGVAWSKAKTERPRVGHKLMRLSWMGECAEGGRDSRCSRHLGQRTQCAVCRPGACCRCGARRPLFPPPPAPSSATLSAVRSNVASFRSNRTVCNDSKGDTRLTRLQFDKFADRNNIVNSPTRYTRCAVSKQVKCGKLTVQADGLQ